MKRITYKDTGPLFLLVKDNEAVGRVCMDELIHVFCDERGERLLGVDDWRVRGVGGAQTHGAA